MLWQRMSAKEAENAVAKIESKDKDEFKSLVEGWRNGSFSKDVDANYCEIRNKIYEVYKMYENKGDYEIDLRVGLALYELFLSNQYKMSPIYADDDDVWRFLSVKVFLDITYLREPEEDRFGKYFSHDRVYKSRKRIWIKQLWWWIHLGWQGDVKSTYAVLRKYGSGCISQILERAGIGYRIDITREMFRIASERYENKVPQKDFTALMMLYYAKMFVVEPTLMIGGVEKFLNQLIDESAGRSNLNGTN